MRNKALSFILALLALAAAAALMIFVIVPAIKGGRTDVPTDTMPALTQAQTESETRQPTTAATQPVTTEPVTTAPATTEPVATEAPTTEPPTEPLPEPTPTDVAEGPGDVHTLAHQSGTVFITEGGGYSAYYFGEKNSTRYCEAVSSVALVAAETVRAAGTAAPSERSSWLSGRDGAPLHGGHAGRHRPLRPGLQRGKPGNSLDV